MKLIVNLSRILVGSLFIVSGLIKANDTMGFGYKLEEYFEPGVLNIPFLIPYATALAAFICIVEIVLGVATLLGGKMKTTAWALLLLIVFFTFLTFYSAYFNKVNDCGCFGDALHLTPWQSFGKDVALLALVLVIFVFRKRIPYNSVYEDRVIATLAVICVAAFSVGMLHWHFPWIFTAMVLGCCMIIKYVLMKSKPSEWTIALFTTLISVVFCYYTYAHLPIKDFRPYRVGTNLPKAMVVPEDAPKDEFKTVLYYAKDGQVKEFTTKNYPWEDSTWVWKDTKTVLVKKGYHAPIHDFKIADAEGQDHTQEFLSDPGYSFMLVSYLVEKADKSVMQKANEFAQECEKNHLKFYGMSGSTVESTDIFRHDVNAMFDYYFCDQTALKTVIRSNPGLVMLKGGTVVAMWHANDFPSFAKVSDQYKLKN